MTPFLTFIATPPLYRAFPSFHITHTPRKHRTSHTSTHNGVARRHRHRHCQEHHLEHGQQHVTLTPSATASTPPPSNSNKPVLKVGQIVAVQRGSNTRPEIARVTGAAASGETVDLQLLEPFVEELYIDSKAPPTYENASAIRAIPSEYAASQNGWIVLNQDVTEATTYFKALREAELLDKNKAKKKAAAVVVQEEDREPLSEEALQRQFFRPSKMQAFFAAALSVPLAAASYSAFVSARETYAANPAGGDLLNAQFFRTFVLFVSAGGSLASLVVGSALFLYALQKNDADE